MIPRLDAEAIAAGAPDALASLREAAQGVGFLSVHNTGLDASRMTQVLEVYRSFFALPETQKQAVNMGMTGANRGWGASGSEQVDPDANADYKQVFDCGFELPEGDPEAVRSVYAPNLWPEKPVEFQSVVSRYYSDSLAVSRRLLRGVAQAIGEDTGFFDDKFTRPMALLRGNYYPQRPTWAGARDFGIATHTDYGCLTLLATDGTPGLEVRQRGGGWLAVTAPVGEFVINFGEMLEMWTAGRVKATPHRVIGSSAERISIPLFFNPNYDTNVAPMGTGDEVLAGEHLTRRFAQTYVHLQDASAD